MYYKTNEQNEIYLASKKQQDGFYYSEEEIVHSYDGQRLMFKHETETPEYIAERKKYLAERQKSSLRRRRECECFPIVNRGQLWYNRLTEAQKAELDAWYGAWLDVTETMTAPDKPEWIG